MEHGRNAKSECSARTRANDKLADISRRYHDGLALTEIDAALTAEGFSSMESAIYCGRDGQSHEQVGERTWLTLCWHKMESGRYEINAYLS